MKDTIGVIAEQIIMKERFKKDGRPLIVGITGADASGKTVMSEKISTYLNNEGHATKIIHVDDFHYDSDKRYRGDMPDYLKYISQSINFDCLKDEFLLPLHKYGVLSLTKVGLDIASDEWSKKISYEIDSDDIVIIEGVFLLRDDVQHYIDMTVYIYAPDEELIRRGRDRDRVLLGANAELRFREKYLPAQHLINSVDRIEKYVDIAVDNTDVNNPILISQYRVGIIFDLWRTIIPLTDEHKASAMRGLKSALKENNDRFEDLWNDDRATRETMPLDAYIRSLRSIMKRSWSDADIMAAKASRISAHISAFTEVDDELLGLLVKLRERGYKLGLISNCTSDMRMMLGEVGLLDLFDSVVLSAEVGTLKPEAAIYRICMEQLNVSDGFYIGDGDNNELKGARQVGLVDVLVDYGEGREASIKVKSVKDFISAYI